MATERLPTLTLIAAFIFSTLLSISCVSDKENLLTNRDFFTCCWVSLLEKLKRTTENRSAKTLAYSISHKINGGLLRSDRLFFSSLTIFSVIQRFFQFFQALKRHKKMPFHRMTLKTMLQKGR